MLPLLIATTLIATYGDVRTLGASLSDGNTVRDYVNQPITFQVAGHVDTEALLWTMDTLNFEGPTESLSFTVTTDPIRQYYDPPGFEPPYEIEPIPGRTYSAALDFLHVDMIPPQWVFPIDPTELQVVFAFETVALATLSYNGIRLDTFFTEPWVRLDCYTYNQCRTFVSLAYGNVGDGLGIHATIANPEYGSLPEPSMLGLIAAALIGYVAANAFWSMLKRG